MRLRPCPAQGIMGVFLREPLAEWQREARVLQRAAARDGAGTGSGPADEDAHLALKALLSCCREPQ